MGQDAELLAAAGTGGAPPVIISNGSAVNDHCSSLASWIITNLGSATTTVTDSTFFFLDGGPTYGTGTNRTNARKGVPFPSGDRWVFSTIFTPISLSTLASGLGSHIQRIGFSNTITCIMSFYSDNITVLGSGGVVALGVAPTIGVSNLFTMDITSILAPANAVADIYLNNNLLVSGIDVAGAITGNKGRITFQQFSREFPYFRRQSKIDQYLLGDKFQGET